jgi:capsular polysaccharide biosynthesis protein
VTHDSIPTLRALKYYADDSPNRNDPKRPRDDVLIHFLTQRSSVTPADPLPGDCLEGSFPYSTEPIVLAILRDGAVVRDGSLVFTKHNELLRESVDRLSSIAKLADRHPGLETKLAALPPEPSPETVAVLGFKRTPNYFHWWIDVLARCWAIRNSPYRSCRLVTPPLTQDFQWESLRLLKLSATPLTRPMQRFRQVVFARGLTFGSSQAIAPQVSEFAQWCRATLELSPPARRRKLFVTRRSAKGRRLLNEEEIVAALGADFELVELETLGVKAEASLFSEASVVVAPHGAGLTNLLFCSGPTGVVELVHDDAPPQTFRHIAGLLGHRYIAIGCEPEKGKGLKPGKRNMTASAAAVVDAVAQLHRSGSEHGSQA